jgi:aconitate hydratase
MGGDSVVGDPFGARARLETAAGAVEFVDLDALRRQGLCDPRQLPYSLRVLLENALRHARRSDDAAVAALSRWVRGSPAGEIDFSPSRVLLQDLTGVPAIVDLAAMRDAVQRRGGSADVVNPLVPVDLVIDHSVQVDAWGSGTAFETNVDLEFRRNRERYALLRWAQGAFANLRVVPPGTGIVHQVNLEYLATVVTARPDASGTVQAFPDTLVGTDSHTTMVNGAGVLGWGVGGIEAEAVLLGDPYVLGLPQVVGVRLSGRLAAGATATDLVLTVTEMLRRYGVVDKFVEFFGDGMATLPVPDRATIANMAPEYGATVGFFPVDAETVRYLRETGRDAAQVDLVERYCRRQGLYHEPGDPVPTYTAVLDLDLGSIEPSLAGPRRPEDRLRLSEVPEGFRRAFPAAPTPAPAAPAAGGVAVVEAPAAVACADGAVAIAAITSCTNTSNPSVMVAAGLLAQRAVERGLRVPSYVKTSLAPGSRVVSAYLARAGLQRYLDALGFQTVGYGCTTCIGNSGAITAEAADAAAAGVALAAVLSGNRNFEGRIHPAVRANFLASPPLVVAYALAGTVLRDLDREPLGHGRDGQPVYLRDLWPRPEEVQAVIDRALGADLFREQYAHVFEGDGRWQALAATAADGALFPWDEASTYVRRPPFVDGGWEPIPGGLRGARILALLGDSITTDHISPAGAIPVRSPAGAYLQERGVAPADFNSYGARRGNHEVMVRGTFANIRLRNRLASREGGYTRHLPSGDELTIFDAAARYQREGTPLVVIAGRDYGKGSSRDWAAKGPKLLGVRAVIAVSYERIHRSNLVGMGILPLQFCAPATPESLGLTGFEEIDLAWDGPLAPHQRVRVTARRGDAAPLEFETVARLDGPRDVGCYLAGGILPQTVGRLLAPAGAH